MWPISCIQGPGLPSSPHLVLRPISMFQAISGHMGPEVCSPAAALQSQCAKNHLMPSICVKKTDVWASTLEIQTREIWAGPRDSVF